MAHYPVYIGTWSIIARAAPFAPLCQATASTQPNAISRAQLPLVLAKVNLGLFAKLLFEWFAIDLPTFSGCWFAVDGKDLRGSIKSGQTRGEACVSVVSQATKAVIGQAYYSSKKESEKLVVRQLLADMSFNNQHISLDALHLNPLTVRSIYKVSAGPPEQSVSDWPQSQPDTVVSSLYLPLLGRYADV